MSRVKALNRNGEVTWCTAKTPGSGNCNHVLHQIDGMTENEFQKRVDEYSETMTKSCTVIIEAIGLSVQRQVMV